MEFKVSVPGKVILHGEHSVVYGKTAIASAIGLRTEVYWKGNATDEVVLHLQDLKAKFTWTFEQFKKLETWNYGSEDIIRPSEELLNMIRETFDFHPDTKWQGSLVTFLFLYNSIAHSARSRGKTQFFGAEITVSSMLPIGAGLGSSAAYSVAIAACLLKVYGRVTKKEGIPAKDELDLVSKWAFQAEVILHGKPSGIDNSVCTYGGALLYRRGHIQEISSSIPLYHILLVNTGVPRNTRLLVDSVKDKVGRHPLMMAHIFDAMDVIARDTWQKLKEHNSTLATRTSEEQKTEKDLYDFAAEMICTNQHLLNSIGVGHPLLDRIASLAKATSPLLAAKLTGAGGGGCGFILLGVGTSGPVSVTPDMVKSMIGSLEQEGLKCWIVDMGCPGVTFR